MINQIEVQKRKSVLKGKLEGWVFKSIFSLTQPYRTKSFFTVLFESHNSVGVERAYI